MGTGKGIFGYHVWDVKIGEVTHRVMMVRCQLNGHRERHTLTSFPEFAHTFNSQWPASMATEAYIILDAVQHFFPREMDETRSLRRSDHFRHGLYQ